MKYSITFALEDIKNGSSDSRELHFKIDNEDGRIIGLLKKDFNFKLVNDWIVSANNKNTISKMGAKWYIKGSVAHADGKKKFYNSSNNTYHYESDFNNAIVNLYPEIEKRLYTGEYNTANNTIKI